MELGKLYQMGVYGPANIVFSSEGVNYEVKSDTVRSGRKYLAMYELLTGCRATPGNAVI